MRSKQFVAYRTPSVPRCSGVRQQADPSINLKDPAFPVQELEVLEGHCLYALTGFVISIGPQLLRGVPAWPPRKDTPWNDVSLLLTHN